MNLSQKGWLRDFLHYRKQQFTIDQEFRKNTLGQDPDHSFYGIVQPTGIMYGYPVQSLNELDASSWSEQETVKSILIDSMINVAELYVDESDVKNISFDQLMNSILENICDFYINVYPEISVSAKSWYGKKKDSLSLAEQILDKRIDMIYNNRSNFWLNFFKRSQLFLDIYIFGQWSHSKPDIVLQEFFKEEKEELSFNAVKTMAAAAHANSHIEEEERALFYLFIESTDFASEKRHVANGYFEHGLGIQDIPIHDTDPWVIRKFFLELALLTTWSDKLVEDKELEFLSKFNESLGFSDDDLQKSMIAIEGFVLENWDQLNVLKDRKDYEQLSNEYLGRIRNIAENYKRRIYNEILKSRKLVDLIKKGSSTELSEKEKEFIKVKLLEILRAIPVFSVIALPDKFLTYNNIIKVVPKDVFTDLHKL